MNRNFMNRAALCALLLVGPALHAQDNSWTISPLDSFANFTVRHMMMTKVHGTVGGMKGTVIYDAKDPTKARVEATLDLSTISTGVAKRDDQLKTDYFDTKKFPLIEFKSTRVAKAGTGKLTMTGNLTIKGVTKQVVLAVDGPSKMMKDAQGRSKIGLTATTKISRKDFGIVGTALDGVVEAGGIIVSDEVAIELDMELMPNTAGGAPAAAVPAH